MLRGRGQKWHELISWGGLFVNSVSLVWNMLWDEHIISPLCATGTLQITVSMLYFHRLFACHLSKSGTRLSWLSQSQAHWPLKLQMLSPAGFKNLQNLAPFAFQANCYGNWFFLYAPLCASFSHALLGDCCSLPITVSLPKCVSILPASFDVASSLSFVVEFVLLVFRSTSGVFMILIVI